MDPRWPIRYALGMRRALLLAPLLLATAWVVYAGAGGVPVGMVWRYGLTPSCAPTGRTMTVEGIEFVEIGAGTFVMGSNLNGELPDLIGRVCTPLDLPWGDPGKLSDEMPVHRVEFPRGFWIAQYEVTHENYEAFDNEHLRDRVSWGDRHPVSEVSFEDASAYCAFLAERSGFPIRLPSESEWEAACRGGTRSEYCFGEDPDRLAEYAWFSSNSKGRAGQVGSRQANPWGLYDLHGNVWEWCEDSYHADYGGAPDDGRAWIARGTSKGAPYRVFRGGEFDLNAIDCRAARRWPAWFDCSVHLGFRLAMGPLED